MILNSLGFGYDVIFRHPPCDSNKLLVIVAVNHVMKELIPEIYNKKAMILVNLRGTTNFVILLSWTMEMHFDDRKCLHIFLSTFNLLILRKIK